MKKRLQIKLFEKQRTKSLENAAASREIFAQLPRRASIMDPPKKLVKRNTAIGLKELISRNSRSSLFGENKKGVFNISIVGQSGVGKSALMVRLLTGRFIGEYAYIYTTGRKTKVINDKEVVLQYTDPDKESARENFGELISKSDAILLVYDLASQNSVYIAEILYMKIKTERARSSKSSLVFLVGNKSDLLMTEKQEEKRSPPIDLMLMGKTTQKRFFWKRNASKSRSDTSLIHNVRRNGITPSSPVVSSEKSSPIGWRVGFGHKTEE